MAPVDTIITEKIKKMHEIRNMQIIISGTVIRIQELNALMGEDKNLEKEHRSEKDELISMLRKSVVTYNTLADEVKSLDGESSVALEKMQAENEKTLRILAGEEPLTTKETIGYTLCGVALVGSGLTFAYFTHGYLAYVFGL